MLIPWRLIKASIKLLLCFLFAFGALYLVLMISSLLLHSSRRVDSGESGPGSSGLQHAPLRLPNSSSNRISSNRISSNRISSNRISSNRISGNRINSSKLGSTGNDGAVLQPVLLIVPRANSFTVPKVLESSRLPFVKIQAQDLPQRLQQDGDGDGQRAAAFSVIVFDGLQVYLGLEPAAWQALHAYCLGHGVGILTLAKPTEEDGSSSTEQGSIKRHLGLQVVHRRGLSHLTISPDAGKFLHIARPGRQYTSSGVSSGSSFPKDWVEFRTNSTSYWPLLRAWRLPPTAVVAVLDRGHVDGIRRIFLGNSLGFWLLQVLFLDGLSHLSDGKLKKSLDRYVQIDIDDLFHARIGRRMTPPDVKELLATQQALAASIPGFQFKLGFSGHFVGQGTADEQEGDALLMQHAGQFGWFPHMWAHTKAHTYTNWNAMIADMKRNFQFAQMHNISTEDSYSVAPYHSGVYPAYALLYKAWKEIWGIKVTSTEEYPIAMPSRKRRGFIFEDIMVLPRQTCGLFTANVLMDDIKGGKRSLDASINGGVLFQNIVANPISVYMTHSGNYGNERLALYLFTTLFSFVQRETNLVLKAMPPLQLGQEYFRLFPQEREPQWTNPCSYSRHIVMLPKSQDCTRLPNLLMIGPQKTGSTALYTFLKLHPNIQSNRKSPTTYEETQFFCSSNYLKGLDWYVDFFPADQQLVSPTAVIFEKSATYFNSADAPRRANLLLPKAKIIAIVIDPGRRAYSWYQHQRVHQIPASLNYTFYEVVTAGPDSPQDLLSLRTSCLDPGRYAHHLQKWLKYYPADQLLVVDGDEIGTDPVKSLLKIQTFLEMRTVVDYGEKLVYNAKKGFYCVRQEGKDPHCMGSNKGRTYPPMDDRSAAYLKDFYRDDNRQLVTMFQQIRQTVPSWLN